MGAYRYLLNFPICPPYPRIDIQQTTAYRYHYQEHAKATANVLDMSKSLGPRPSRKKTLPARYRDHDRTESDENELSVSHISTRSDRSTETVLQRAQPAAFSTKEWLDPISMPEPVSKVDSERKKVTELDVDPKRQKSSESRRKGRPPKLTRLGSAAFAASTINSSFSHSPVLLSTNTQDEKKHLHRCYPGPRINGHGIPANLELRAKEKCDHDQERKKARQEVARERSKHRWTPEAVEEERKYLKGLVQRTRSAMWIGGPACLHAVQQPNVVDSLSDRLAFEDSMATSDEEEDDDVSNELFKSLNPKLKWSVITKTKEDVQGVENYLPANSGYHFASCTVVGIKPKEVDTIEREVKV